MSSGNKKPAKKNLIGIVIVLIVIVLFTAIVAFFTHKNYFLHPHMHKTASGKYLPDSQSADCPDAELISIPGTWESSSHDDPTHPRSNPRALLIPLTQRLENEFPASRLEVYTVPYVAQFQNPNKPHDKSYTQSRILGQQKTEERLKTINDHCPLTKIIMVGFSQGAVIAGDIASDIGNQRGPIDPDNIVLVGLIADGRRVPTQGKQIGVPLTGEGAEVSLAGFDTSEGSAILNIPEMFHFSGIELRGERAGGFGSLNDRTLQFCAPNDVICDCPKISLLNIFTDISHLAKSFQPIHGSYGTTRYWKYNNESALQWLGNKIIEIVKAIPPAPHH